jgi:hypothetical protein
MAVDRDPFLSAFEPRPVAPPSLRALVWQVLACGALTVLAMAILAGLRGGS